MHVPIKSGLSFAVIAGGAALAMRWMDHPAPAPPPPKPFPW